MDEHEGIVVNEKEEAEFIQNYLLVNGRGFIATQDISLIIDGQMKYMESIGLIGFEE